MRRVPVALVLVVLCVTASWMAAQGGQASELTVQEVLARMPHHALVRLPAWALQQALDGEMPAADLAAMAGMAPSVHPDATTPLASAVR